MSLGYAQGKFWVPDDRFAHYAARDSYKALVRATHEAGFTFQCQYSYTARVYTAEILTVERAGFSAQHYVIKHCNAYDPNPMAAIVKAIQAFERKTPLVSACCLVIEVELLRETYMRVKVAEDRLCEAIDTLIGALESTRPGYDCEDCIGMFNPHGCYCAAMGCAAPGVPPLDEDDDL